MKKISQNEAAIIQQKLDSSSLDEETISIIKGLISGQTFLLDLFTKFIETSGHHRTKIIQELAKILEIDLKQKSVDDQKKNPSQDEQQNSSEEEKQTSENTKENADRDSSETSEKDNLEKKKHPKRSNDQFQPVASPIHFHENLEPGDICPACLQGKVYAFREKIIPILIGRTPFAFEEHRLQTLRCNACGAIFEPKLPQEIPKTGRSMPSAQAILTLMHYKIGVPFTSIAVLQKMANQNVSPSQLWEVIEQAANAAKPVYEELKKLASNSKTFYTDDTSARILSHYPENKRNREKRTRKKNPKDRVGAYSSVIIGYVSDDQEIYLFYHGRK